jgi:hypothetical protein
VDGANLTLLYVTIYAIFSRWQTNRRVAAILVSCFAVAIAITGLVTLELGLRGGHPQSMFLDWQLALPVGYHNGDAALFLMALFPALYLASRRELSPLGRGLLAASASVLVQMTVLAQSRGSLFAFPLVLVIFFCLVSGRGRAIATTVFVLGISASNLAHLLDVYQVGKDGNGDFPHALATARNGIVVTSLAVFVVGTLFAFVDRRISISERRSRLLDRGTATLAAIAVVTTVVVALIAINSPVRRVDNAWTNFKNGTGAGDGSSHFTSLYGTNRYDFWRVSLRQFKKHPITGSGVENFTVDYVRERRSNEEPTTPHSLEIRMLSQTGLIGSALFLAFLAAALAATRARGLDPLRSGLIGACLASVAYWLVHGSVDWFWELPALGAAAFALLGLAASLASSDRYTSEPSVATRRRLGAALVVSALLVSASYVPPWLSARDVEIASQSWRSDPAKAYRLLDQARSLNRLDENPDLVAGAIAARRHEYERMRLAYARALERNSLSWYAYLELGLAETLTGRREAAIAHLARARQLNPREPLIRQALAKVRAGERVDPEAINRVFLERALQFEVSIR